MKNLRIKFNNFEILVNLLVDTNFLYLVDLAENEFLIIKIDNFNIYNIDK